MRKTSLHSSSRSVQRSPAAGGSAAGSICTAVHQGGRRPVDTFKGVKALGAGLDRPASQDHLAVKGHKDAECAGGGHGEGDAQVLQRVGERVFDGELGAGEHHGDRNAAEHEAEHRRGVGHGVGAVGDHHAVICGALIVDSAGDELPLLRLDVGGVQVQDIADCECVILGEQGKMAGQRVPVHAGSQSLLRGPGGDGPPGGKQKNMFHLILLQ